MDSKLFFSILIILLVALFTDGLPIQEELHESSNCKLETGNLGVCKKIDECPSRLREVIDGKRDADSTGRCGFKKYTEIVCCQLDITKRIRLQPEDTISPWPAKRFIFLTR